MGYAGEWPRVPIEGTPAHKEFCSMAAGPIYQQVSEVWVVR